MALLNLLCFLNPTCQSLRMSDLVILQAKWWHYVFNPSWSQDVSQFTDISRIETLGCKIFFREGSGKRTQTVRAFGSWRCRLFWRHFYAGRCGTINILHEYMGICAIGQTMHTCIYKYIINMYILCIYIYIHIGTAHVSLSYTFYPNVHVIVYYICKLYTHIQKVSQICVYI